MHGSLASYSTRRRRLRDSGGHSSIFATGTQQISIGPPSTYASATLPTFKHHHGY
jgi:hypothetical protein